MAPMYGLSSLHHPLIGARFGPMLRTLLRHGGIRPRRIPMVLIALLISALRWPNCTVEAARTRYAGRIEHDPPPVFIVGHWRSGTTLLHHILSRDPTFCFPRLIDVLSPHEFFPSPLERYTHPLIFRLLPPTRPMDAMPVDPELPQEEELALAAMAAPSFFNCLYFPSRFEQIFRNEVLLQSEDGVTLLEEWCTAYRHYVGKLALRYPGRRLLLKNPANGARIRMLATLFPGAKFIHIHRHPHDVYRSMTKLYERMLPALALQDYDAASIKAQVLHGYLSLMTALLDDCATLPENALVTLSYAELVAQPMAAVGRIYRQLNLTLTAAAIEHMKEFFAQTPIHAAPATPLPDEVAATVFCAWERVIRRLNYS